MTRTETIKRIWELVEPSSKGYSDLIDRLMANMSIEQLKAVQQAMDNSDD